VATISYQEILITSTDKLLNKDTGSSRIFLQQFLCHSSLCTVVQCTCFCIYETWSCPLFPRNPRSETRRRKASGQDYVTWSSTPGVLKRDSFSWSSENRERSQIARTIFYGGSIFLTKCSLLETSNGITSRETKWIRSTYTLERCFYIMGAKSEFYKSKLKKSFNCD